MNKLFNTLKSSFLFTLTGTAVAYLLVVLMPTTFGWSGMYGYDTFTSWLVLFLSIWAGNFLFTYIFDNNHTTEK